jgi:hypothetical protein
MVKEAIAGMVAVVFALGMTSAGYAQTPAPKAEEKKPADTMEKKTDKKAAEKTDKKPAAKKEAKADKKAADAKAPDAKAPAAPTAEKKAEKPGEAKK